MIITLAALKGGVGKTTTAIHIADYLQQKTPTLLIDADKNRSALTWAREGKLAYKVVSSSAAPKYVKEYEHIVIDTQARPSPEDLKDLAEGCDLMMLPTAPRGLDLDALMQTVEIVKPLGARFRILLTMVPPQGKAAQEARESLEELELPVFKAEIKRLVAFERAPLMGVSVREYPDPRAVDAWKYYEKLGEEILHES